MGFRPHTARTAHRAFPPPRPAACSPTSSSHHTVLNPHIGRYKILFLLDDDTFVNWNNLVPRLQQLENPQKAAVYLNSQGWGGSGSPPVPTTHGHPPPTPVPSVPPCHWHALCLYLAPYLALCTMLDGT